MVQFKTTKEKHVDGILAMLSELYQGRPVTSVRIGQGAGRVIRGWVPTDAEVRHTLLGRPVLPAYQIAEPPGAREAARRA